LTLVWPAVDQHGRVIDVLVSKKRDGVAARRFSPLPGPARPVEVTTYEAGLYPMVIDKGWG
jgi:DDE domain